MRYDYFVRLGVIAALVALAAPAAADPLEWSGFLGVDKLPSDIGLGSTDAPEQRPQTAPIVGGRITYFPLESQWIALGVEGELAQTTSWTGYGFDSRRNSYFAPLIGYRADAIVRLFPHAWFQPHVVGGGGGVTVATASPFMSNQTDGEYFWGAGLTLPVQGRWLLRADARQVFLPAMTSGDTTTAYELHVAIGGTFGPAAKVIPVHVEEAPPPPPPQPQPDRDRDGDGIVDRLDTCPDEPESKNGIDDEDGCPEPDPDGDGIVGAADKCPNQAEDLDKFQDEDGCPDPDNDGDGIPDGKDACPKEAETKNGIDDEDGCPDQVPPAIAAAFEAASAVRFEPGKARMTKAGKASLGKTLGALRDHPMLKVTITGHDKDAELAKKRAEAVKWYLVDQGVAQDQIETVAGPEAKQPIEIMSR